MASRWYLMQQIHNMTQTVQVQATQQVQQLQTVINKLAVFSFTISIPASNTILTAQNLGMDKLLLKTLRVTSDSGEDFAVKLYNTAGTSGRDTIYENNTTGYSTANPKDGIYDLLDLPYVDDDATNALHLEINNQANKTATFTVKVQGLTLN